MPIAAPTSPQDATGRATELAAKAKQKELRERQDEITLIRQAEEESLAKDIFDPKHPDAPIVLDEIEEVGIPTDNDKVTIRTIADIDDMTFGVGNNYTFRAGVRYSVPRPLAAHLQRLGYLWLA